jgi:hypothetical protein
MFLIAEPIITYGHYHEANTYWQDAVEFFRRPWSAGALALVAISLGLMRRLSFARVLVTILLLLSTLACLTCGAYLAYNDGFLVFEAITGVGITVSVSSLLGCLYFLAASESVRREFQ